jgi:hypothetical protein
MATQIRRNPILEGRDAERFLRQVSAVEKGNIPDKERKLSRKMLKEGERLSKVFSFFKPKNNDERFQFC